MPKDLAKKTLVMCAAVMLVLPQSMFGQEGEKKTEEEKVSTILRIQVIGTDQGSEGPVEGAEVYVKSEAEGVEYEREVSTTSRGIAKLDDVPRGKVLIQVTAEEWVPFGGRFDVNEEEQSIPIKLKKPQE
jgi:hypothetical protein